LSLARFSFLNAFRRRANFNFKPKRDATQAFSTFLPFIFSRRLSDFADDGVKVAAFFVARANDAKPLF
jgi:hypothetical protein